MPSVNIEQPSHPASGHLADALVEEEAVGDQLAPVVEEVGQRHLAIGALEAVLLVTERLAASSAYLASMTDSGTVSLVDAADAVNDDLDDMSRTDLIA